MLLSYININYDSFMVLSGIIKVINYYVSGFYNDGRTPDG